MATLPPRGPRLSADTQALTAPVDAAIDAEARRATLTALLSAPETEAAQPYLERHRPIIQAQLNPVRRQHPDWPEEWYIHVPGTALTWSPRAAARAGYPRPQIRAFPSAAEAEAAAQAAWREHWTERKVKIGADSVISPEVRAEFTVRWNDAADLAALAAWRPEDGHLPLATVIRTRDVPADVIGPLVPRRGLDGAHAFPPDAVDWDAQDQAVAASDAAWRARSAARAPTGPVEPWRHPVAQNWLRTTATVLAGLQDQPETAAAVQRALDAVHVSDHPEMTVRHPKPFLDWVDAAHAAGGPALDAWAQEARLLRGDDIGLFRSGTIARPGGPHDFWTHPDAQRWIRATHHVLDAARALPERTDHLRIRAAVMDAVGAVYSSEDPTAVIAGPRPFLRAVDTAVAVTHAVAPTLLGPMRAWADAAQHLRDHDVSLFRAGTVPPEVILSPDDPLAQSLLDHAEIRVQRMPNGGFVLWTGTDHPEPGERGTVTWTGLKVYGTLAEVREAADAAGALYLAVERHPDVVAHWTAAVEEKYGDRAPEIIRRVTTPPTEDVVRRVQHLLYPTPASPAGPQPGDPDAAGTIHVSPWDPGHVLWWRDTPTGLALFGSRDAEGVWHDADPQAPPVPTPAPQGFRHAVTQAQAADPAIVPADLPPYLARQCAAAGVYPTATPGNRDCLWHIADLAFAGQAVAWTRPWSADQLRQLTRSHGLEPARARALGDPETGRVVAFRDGTRMHDKLTAIAVVAGEPCPVVPAEVARAWAHSAQREAFHQTARLPRDPFTVLGRLSASAQRGLITGLDPQLQPAAWAAVSGLEPRETAEFWQAPVATVTGLYRRAEQALAFEMDLLRDRPVAAIAPAQL